MNLERGRERQCIQLCHVIVLTMTLSQARLLYLQSTEKAVIGMNLAEHSTGPHQDKASLKVAGHWIQMYLYVCGLVVLLVLTSELGERKGERGTYVM